MTDKEEILLAELDCGSISESAFLDQFPHDIKHDSSYLNTELRAALLTNDNYRLEYLLPLIWLTDKIEELTNVLNQLLVYPDHFRHQEIARLLQAIKSPSTIPFIRQSLESGFQYLDYTCSEPQTIAKWFSHLLADIGTEEALSLIKEFTNKGDEGIQKEMIYRLRQLEAQPDKGA